MRLFSDVASLVDDPMLARALSLAEKGRGTTSPNPMVGCVLVRAGAIVGEGFHARAGGPHAEVAALTSAGDAARGSTAYVTLEPCTHFGQTPPCSNALIDAGVARVVIGMSDPGREAGGGAEALRAAGIEIAFAADPAPFEELNEAWLQYARTGRPYVHVKVALSLDARPTREYGVRCAVSGPGGGNITMRLRSAADAIVVGAATAATDAPALTVRDDSGATAPRQPLRAVVGTKAVPDARLFHDGLGESVALLPAGVEAPDDVTMLEYDSDRGIEGALVELADRRDVRRILVEAGPRMFSVLWAADLIDELTLVHAGGVFGDRAPALFLGSAEESNERLRCRMQAVEAGVVEGDAVTVWRPRD